MKNSHNIQLRKDSYRGVPRRDLLAAISAATLLGGSAQPAPSATEGPMKISIFSKHFQWTNCREMAAIAKVITKERFIGPPQWAHLTTDARFDVRRSMFPFRVPVAIYSAPILERRRP